MLLHKFFIAAWAELLALSIGSYGLVELNVSIRALSRLGLMLRSP